MNLDEQRMWEELHPGEAQQLAYVKMMEDAQQVDEYKNSCARVIDMLKEIRKQVSNDQEFGTQVAKILKGM